MRRGALRVRALLLLLAQRQSESVRQQPLHCTALHCTALHCTALHCTALHCTALHCSTNQQAAAGKACRGSRKKSRGGWRIYRRSTPTQAPLAEASGEETRQRAPPLQLQQALLLPTPLTKSHSTARMTTTTPRSCCRTIR
jgi:hypothetical protein